MPELTKFQTLMLSTLIAGGLALPASALTLGAETGLTVSIGTEAGAKAHAADNSAVLAAALEADAKAKAQSNG